MDIQTIVCIIFLTIITLMSNIKIKFKNKHKYIFYFTIIFSFANVLFNTSLNISFKGVIPLNNYFIVIIFISTFFISLTYTQSNQFNYMHISNDKIYYFFKGCIAIPIYEEFLFRGYIQSTFLLSFNMYITFFIVISIFLINHDYKNNRMNYLIVFSPILSYFATYNMIYNICLHITINFGCFIKFYYIDKIYDYI